MSETKRATPLLHLVVQMRQALEERSAWMVSADPRKTDSGHWTIEGYDPNHVFAVLDDVIRVLRGAMSETPHDPLTLITRLKEMATLYRGDPYYFPDALTTSAGLFAAVELVDRTQAQAFLAGQASCAPWMQHKAGCDLLADPQWVRYPCPDCGATGKTDKPTLAIPGQCMSCKGGGSLQGIEQVSCSCGLDAHRTPEDTP